MGTNYYWYPPVKPPCECCKRPYETERKHIGKSSVGWCFALHVYPEEGINDLCDWESLFAIPGSVIMDEYAQVKSIVEMEQCIMERSRDDGLRKWSTFEYDENHAVPGPNNLVRSRIGGSCIKHGSGTWDCIVGEFS